jgi:hypothetical protein
MWRGRVADCRDAYTSLALYVSPAAARSQNVPGPKRRCTSWGQSQSDVPPRTHFLAKIAAMNVLDDPSESCNHRRIVIQYRSRDLARYLMWLHRAGLHM